MRPDDLQADPLRRLQRLAARDERREHEIAQRAVLREERAQGCALHRDVAQRLRYQCADEDGLAQQEVQLAEEAGRTVPYELVAGRVDDRDLPFEDRDERIRAIAHAVEPVTDGGRALLADLSETRGLR